MVGGNGQSIGSTVPDDMAVAGCGRMKLGAGRWATSGALLQVVYN